MFTEDQQTVLHQAAASLAEFFRANCPLPLERQREQAQSIVTDIAAAVKDRWLIVEDVEVALLAGWPKAIGVLAKRAKARRIPAPTVNRSWQR